MVGGELSVGWLDAGGEVCGAEALLADLAALFLQRDQALANGLRHERRGAHGIRQHLHLKVAAHHRLEAGGREATRGHQRLVACVVEGAVLALEAGDAEDGLPHALVGDHNVARARLLGDRLLRDQSL